MSENVDTFLWKKVFPIGESNPWLDIHSLLADSILPKVCARIQPFLRAFSVTTNLELHLVTFFITRDFVELVSRLPRLEKISIVATFLDNSTPNFGPCPESGDSYGPFIHWLNSSSPSIHTLSLGALPAAALPTVSQLLQSLGLNLKALDLALMYQVTAGEIDTHIDLSSNTHLRRLCIHVSLRRFHGPDGLMHARAPWALLAAVRSAVRSPLTTLTIELTLVAVVVLDNIDWDYLNTTLLTGERFRGLRRLEFVIVTHWIEGDEDGALEPEIRARVPELEARVIVEVLQKNPVWWEGF